MKTRFVLWAAVIVGCGGGESAGPPCAQAADCDDTNACTIDACEMGVCVYKAAPDGDQPVQWRGDCSTLVCRWGVGRSVIDWTDIVSDFNDCTVDRCDADGMPVHTAAPYNTDCTVTGKAGLCDNLGACKAIDCNCDDMNPCTTDGCPYAQWLCEYSPLDGVLVPGFKQVAGDCGVHMCVSGSEAAVADDTDVPNSSNDCVVPTCMAGAPSLPAANMGTACNTSGGKVCDGNGACVECNVDADCAPPLTCTGNPKKCQ
jgi:hypothetical protein